MQLVAYPELVVVVWEINLVEHSTFRSTLPVTTIIKKSLFAKLVSVNVSCSLRPHQLSIQGQRQIKTDIFNQSFSVNRYQFVELYQNKICATNCATTLSILIMYTTFLLASQVLQHSKAYPSIDPLTQSHFLLSIVVFPQTCTKSDFGHKTAEKTPPPYIERPDLAKSMDVISKEQSTAMIVQCSFSAW